MPILRGTVCLFYCMAWSLCAYAETTAETPDNGTLLFVAESLYAPSVSTATESGKTANASEAEGFFLLARQACEQGDVGAALRWAAHTLRSDPDHAGARRVLGYRRVGDHWAGSYAARRLERDEVWNSEFGWIRAEDIARYEAGERRLGKRWISAEDDARRHAKIDKGWQIRTDHFHVRTNYRREDASELAVRLETLYQLWQQLFGAFYLDANQLLKRWDGKEIGGYRNKPFKVVYYRSRDEYNALLVRKQPRIAMTLGIYFDTLRSSHFFAGPQQDPGTIYHEAVHQLFQESTRSARDVGALANAWASEGVACYFESLTEEPTTAAGRCFRIGASEAGRLPAARHRRLVDDYYVPLQELTLLGMDDLQRRDDLPRLYSQSAGLATFFMHYRDGVYRQAFVQYLQLIYLGRDTPRSLAELTGQSFQQLDRQYLDFLREFR